MKSTYFYRENPLILSILPEIHEIKKPQFTDGLLLPHSDIPGVGSRLSHVLKNTQNQLGVGRLKIIHRTQN